MSEQKEYVITEEQMDYLYKKMLLGIRGITNNGCSPSNCMTCFENTFTNVRSHPIYERTKLIEDNVINTFEWVRPLCFGKHEAICDTRCPWSIRKRCVGSIRG